jgi:hypothetical protein
MDVVLQSAVEGYRKRLRELCDTEPIGQRCLDIAKSRGLSEEEATVMIAVHALECLKATQKELMDAMRELPPDAFYVRNEEGERQLVRYIGPTIAELRAEASLHSIQEHSSIVVD